MPTRLPKRVSRRAFLSGSAGALGLILTGCNRGEAPAALAGMDLSYPNEEIFATTTRVADRLDNPDLRILDCSDLPDYRRGHLPGARHVWWQDTIEIHNPVYGMLVNADGRGEIARRAGIEPESEVVCYDADGGIYAARVAWTLRYMGFRNTRLLPGGANAWRADGHSLTRDEPDDRSGGIPDIFDESIVAHPQDILSRMDEEHLALLDTRTEAERDETWNNRLRPGTIPGSAWMPRTAFLDEHEIPVASGVLIDRLSTVLDLDDTAEVIVYGLHGTLASLPYYLLLALDRFHVRLYDGSWSQWGSDPSLPLSALDL